MFLCWIFLAMCAYFKRNSFVKKLLVCYVWWKRNEVMKLFCGWIWVVVWLLVMGLLLCSWCELKTSVLSWLFVLSKSSFLVGIWWFVWLMKLLCFCLWFLVLLVLLVSNLMFMSGFNGKVLNFKLLSLVSLSEFWRLRRRLSRKIWKS